MIRKLAVTLIALASLAISAAAQADNTWIKDQVTVKADQVAQKITTYSPRLRGVIGSDSAKSSWHLNEMVERNNNTGTWLEPVWQGKTTADAVTTLCHNKDCSRFTLILVARKDFTSQCIQKGQKFGITFVQIVRGSVSGDKGFQWSIQTVPLPGPIPIGDIAQNEIERFNSWSLYRDVYRSKIEMQFPKIAEAAKRYEAYAGANAWIEPGVIGADAPLPPRKCGEVALPLATKTNQ